MVQNHINLQSTSNGLNVAALNPILSSPDSLVLDIVLLYFLSRSLCISYKFLNSTSISSSLFSSMLFADINILRSYIFWFTNTMLCHKWSWFWISLKLVIQAGVSCILLFMSLLFSIFFSNNIQLFPLDLANKSLWCVKYVWNYI